MSLFGGNKSKPSTASEPKRLGSMNIQSAGYGNTIPVVFGKTRLPVTLFYYGNFKANPVMSAEQQQAGKGGKKPKQTLQSYSYTAAIALGIAAHAIQSIARLWVDKNKYASVAELGFSVFTGLNSQIPWGYLSTFEPAKAVNLRGFSYMAVNNYPLSDNASIGNHSVEVLGLFCNNVTNDANPADIVPWLMIEQCGLSVDLFAPITNFRAACEAHDWWFSVALSEQNQANDVIAQMLKLCDTELVIRSGYIDFINYKDAGLVTGYNLSTDDFIAERGSSYLKPTRKKAIDCFNALKVEFLNRDNDYNIEIAEAKDQASIAEIGLRTAETVTAHCICRAGQARMMAEQLLQRDLAIRNSYEFTLSIRYILLEPMDVVTITDPVLGLYGRAVVIKKIVLTPDFKLHVTAEDSVWGTTDYVNPPPAAVIEPYQPNQNATVGNINPPVIFKAPAELTATGKEIWCAISSPDALYGGCAVYMSTDGGTSYNFIGNHDGQTRMGVVTADFVAGATSLLVDVSESNGVMNTVDTLAFDSLSTLCRAGSEFIAYQTATLSAPNQYALTPLHRALYGSSEGASLGSSFVRCDATLFKVPYTIAYEGITLKLKFVAYNIYQNGLQDLASVPAYDFTIGGGVLWDSGATIWDSGSTNWT
jgi:hypothetical protein